MNILDKIINSLDIAYRELSSDEHGRYHSWEYCYKAFHDARNQEMIDCDLI